MMVGRRRMCFARWRRCRTPGRERPGSLMDTIDARAIGVMIHTISGPHPTPSPNPSTRNDRRLSPPTPPTLLATDSDRPVTRRRLLITAGPTQEPIDAVRFIGNRSSGRLGVALADHAAAHGWQTTLLLGPTATAPPFAPSDSRVRVVRFRTTAELGALLDEHFPSCDVLIMAAAVADYRPIMKEGQGEGKLRRTDQKLVIELEPTPD